MQEAGEGNQKASVLTHQEKHNCQENRTGPLTDVLAAEGKLLRGQVKAQRVYDWVSILRA